MQYDLSSVSTSKKVSPYLIYGDGQELKINKLEISTSRNTGSPKVILHMESRPITSTEFTPIEGSQGKIGKIGCGVYLKNEKQKEEFFKKMKMIAQALDVEDDFNLIKGNTFEDVVSKIEDVICGNKWARYTIFGEQYSKADGSIGLRLMLPRWAFVESLDVPIEDSKLIKFDENNSIHFKKIVRVQNPEGTGFSDLPF